MSAARPPDAKAPLPFLDASTRPCPRCGARMRVDRVDVLARVMDLRCLTCGTALQRVRYK